MGAPADEDDRRHRPRSRSSEKVWSSRGRDERDKFEDYRGGRSRANEERQRGDRHAEKPRGHHARDSDRQHRSPPRAQRGPDSNGRPVRRDERDGQRDRGERGAPRERPRSRSPRGRDERRDREGQEHRGALAKHHHRSGGDDGGRPSSSGRPAEPTGPGRPPHDSDRDHERGPGPGDVGVRRGGRPPRRGRDEDEGPVLPWGKPEDEPPPPAAPPVPVAPNMGLSGKLAAETNAINGVVVKFQPPPEAVRCTEPRWRLYVFKGSEMVGDPLPLDRFPFFLFGKERRIADIPTDHPTCSRQHAVICFRSVARADESGVLSQRVAPYLMDLETANGTFLNGERIEASRFYELLEKDVIKFGYSTREYVLLHTASA